MTTAAPLLARLLLGLALLGPAAAAAVAADAAPRPAPGDVVGELGFKDIRYLPRTLRDFGDREAFVLVFTNTTCPLAQRSWPKLARLEQDYRDRGVQFVAVNVGVDDAIPDIAQQAIDFGVEFPFVKDADHSCVRATGAERTPEVVVLDRERRLRYRGRIDDQLRLGGTRPAATREDLREALDDLLAGRAVAVAETPVDGCLITAPPERSPRTDLTFHEHVEPLLQKHCQECHHDGGPAPFALVDADEVAGHAGMIAETVAEGRMPPWYAGRKHAMANARGMSAEERAIVADWVAAGTPAGDPAKAPERLVFSDSEWEIGTPDLVTTALETHTLPADGFVDYKYVILPHVFLRDTWISAAEILPSNPRVVHHCNLAFATIGSKFSDGNFITGRVPGGTPMVLDDGIALCIPAGSVLALQIHYTTTGKPETNRMSVGLRYPRTRVHKRLHHEQVTTQKIEIPAGAPAHPVIASRVLPCNASGLGMFAHMHLRGKDMTFLAHPPVAEGAEAAPPETLLTIPNYHYGWQQNYRWEPGSRSFPRGTRIEVVAHYDNSAFNPFNPDAGKVVRHGPQTVDEMMFGFFFYTDDDEDLDLAVDPATGHVLPAAPATGDAAAAGS